MTFSRILFEMSNRVTELCEIDKKLREKYSIAKQETEYEKLLAEINKNNGNFFFVIDNFKTKPKIEILSKERYILQQPKISMPLDNFLDTELFEQEIVKQIEKENKLSRKREIKETKAKMQEYARYLHLRKKFENE